LGKISKIAWISITILSIVPIIWFILGSTAFFNRSLDLIATTYLVSLWVPLLLLFILSTTLLLVGWSPSNKNNIMPLWILLLVIITLSLLVIRVVHTSGWLHDRIFSDPKRITSDGKYEYNTDLVNLFQKNSHERIYIRNIETGEELYIPVKLIDIKIHGIGISTDDDWAWTLMNSTDSPNQYELITTEELPVTKKRFLIDISNCTSHLIE